jgi:hypothetical protein
MIMRSFANTLSKLADSLANLFDESEIKPQSKFYSDKNRNVLEIESHQLRIHVNDKTHITLIKQNLKKVSAIRPVADYASDSDNEDQMMQVSENTLEYRIVTKLTEDVRTRIFEILDVKHNPGQNISNLLEIKAPKVQSRPKQVSYSAPAVMDVSSFEQKLFQERLSEDPNGDKAMAPVTPATPPKTAEVQPLDNNVPNASEWPFWYKPGLYHNTEDKDQQQTAFLRQTR